MKVQVLTLQKNESSSIDLPDAVFTRTYRGSSYYALKAELANRRVGTASTKNRSRVRGGGRKPWRQKGLGRARAGSIASPLWRGGGVIFGPKIRDYSVRVPTQQKKAAMMELLSDKVSHMSLKIVSEFTFATGKTKDAVALLYPITKGKKTLLVMSSEDALTKRALRNIPWLRYVRYNRLSVHTILYADIVLITHDALVPLASLLQHKKRKKELVKIKEIQKSKVTNAG